MDVRQVALLPGARPGVMQAQYGRTRVLASVSADMVSPFPDRPAEG
jgi:exosome complex RNA-binding protein Rrp42 (RNase PH superfamily)